MKKLISSMLAIAVLGSCTACGSESSSESSSSSAQSETNGVINDDTKATAEEKMTEHIADTDKTIGIAMPAQELERWNKDGEYLKNRFETVGYSVELVYSNNDADQQKEDVQALIDKDVDLLLIAAVKGNTLVEPLEQAKEKDIPVVAYDRLIMDTDALTYYISFDNYAVGKLQGEYVSKTLNLNNPENKYNIEFVAGDAGDNNALYVFNGAYNTLKPYIDKGILTVRSGKTAFEDVVTTGWTTENAKANMEATLSTYYVDQPLGIALCANDSTALGVTQALESTYTQENQPLIIGQDGDIENLKNIVDGKQAMTVYKNVNDEASVAFVVCKSILAGNTPAASLLEDMPVEVNYDSGSYNNGKKYIMSYLLVPTVITKDNLQYLADTGIYQWDDEHKYLDFAK